MVKLNVIVPVKRIVIKGKGNITYSGMIGPFKEGETLTLICEARGGFPTPVLTWRRGSRILPSTTSVDEQGIVRSELIFTNIRREDLLTVLTCQGSNNNITGPIYTSVTVDMNLKPQRIQITSLLSALKAGEQVEVNCQTEGSRPPARISWRKGPERIDHMAIQNIFGSITVSTLSFKASAADHGKLLICEAQNPKLPESALQDSWMLNVLYPPQLSLVFGASEQYEHLREGSDVYFECNIQANPAVTDVKWKFQGRHLNPNPLKGIVILNHSLLLHNVSRYHRGMYQCQAFNAQGKGKSEEVVLRIQYAPVCSEKQRQSYGVAKNEEIDVSCSVDSDPQDIVFWWIFNNTGAETRTIKTFDNNLMKNRSIVKFAPETQMDYGALYCFAKNSVGTINEPCIFHIVPTGPPESLQNCSIMNQTFNSLSFLCEVGDDGGMKQTFHLEVYSMRKELLLANITQYESPNFTVRNLPAGTAFVIAIYSSNNKGRSSTVVLTAATLYSTAMQIEEKNRSIIGIVLLVSLAAVGTLALLAAAALVTVFKNKARSPTREELPIHRSLHLKMETLALITEKKLQQNTSICLSQHLNVFMNNS
nr:nephrin [Parasteatoda tepidariorum]